MIRVMGQQGSLQWITARCGIPTASRFSQVITPKTLAPSKSATAYMHELLAEWALGEPIEMETTAMMDRGTELEDAARRAYEFQRNVKVEQVGLCLADDSMVGCSPDGLIGDSGGLEIKTPGIKNHVKYMLDHDALVAEYRLQIHGSMLVCSRDWWDVMSYNPLLPDVIVRVDWDKEIENKIAAAVQTFSSRLTSAMCHMQEMGVTGDPRPFEARRQIDAPEPQESEAA